MIDMSNLRIAGVTKKFPGVVALNNVSLEIDSGKLFTLLGPSGCGKTTLLRTIAGFYKADVGHIYLGNELLDNTPAFKRDIGMVFQSYAVFPHMNVLENVAYGLKIRKLAKNEIQKRVSDVLALVKLTSLAQRKPSQLSGGQQQRVALARAVVINPRLLLMDEPLSNLDAKLRVEMRSEIKKLQSELHVTTVYVTHDQEEALAISDRIAVFNTGIVMQCGIPWELYQEPANPFVANFLGRMNFIRKLPPGAIVGAENGTAIPDNLGEEGRELIIGVRPEDISIHVARGNTAGLWLEGRITNITFLGPIMHFEAEVSGDNIEAVTFKNVLKEGFSVGDQVFLHVPLANIRVFGAEAR